jgi:sterol desaturase/sphingolipid hydroxylase (fatty acid hydroxylase superfamily)
MMHGVHHHHPDITSIPFFIEIPILLIMLRQFPHDYVCNIYIAYTVYTVFHMLIHDKSQYLPQYFVKYHDDHHKNPNVNFAVSPMAHVWEGLLNIVGL